MKKIRSYLAIIALVATLSCPIIFQASGSLASVAPHHAGSAVTSVHRFGPCPVPGTNDC